MKDSINKIISKLKENKRLSVVIIIVITIVLLSTSQSKKQTDNENGPINSPVPTVRISKDFYESPEKTIQRNNPETPLLLNAFDVATGNTLGYSWSGNKIVYAKSSGIYNLWQNEQVVKGSITKINFTSTGFSTHKGSGEWSLFDPTKNSSTKLGINSDNVITSKDGSSVLFTQGNSLMLKSLADNSQKNKDIASTNDVSFGFLDNKNLIYLNDNKNSVLEIFDINLNSVKKLEFKSEGMFLDVSKDGEYLATSNNKDLIIKNINSADKGVIKISFQGEISGNWLDETNFFVYEYRRREFIDLYDTYFWMVSTKGQQKFLSNSFPITNEVDRNMKVFFNNDKTGIALNEKSGKIWVLSLVPSFIPAYTNEGFLLLQKPINKQDSH